MNKWGQYVLVQLLEHKILQLLIDRHSPFCDIVDVIIRLILIYPCLTDLRVGKWIFISLNISPIKPCSCNNRSCVPQLLIFLRNGVGYKYALCYSHYDLQEYSAEINTVSGRITYLPRLVHCWLNTVWKTYYYAMKSYTRSKTVYSLGNVSNS